MKVKQGILHSVSKKDLNLLSSKPQKFWKGVHEIAFGAFSGLDDLVEISIPNCVEYVEKEAFINCANLEKISFGKSVSKIDFPLSIECDKFKSVSIDGGNEFYQTTKSGKAIILKNHYELVFFAPCGGESYIVPSNVKKISHGAFLYNRKLKALKILGNTEIEANAFDFCENLEQLSLGNNVSCNDEFFGSRDCRFRYFYKNKQNENVFLKNLPNDVIITSFVNLDKFQSVISNFNYEFLFDKDDRTIRLLNNIVETFIKKDIVNPVIPVRFLQSVIFRGELENFSKALKTFLSHMQPLVKVLSCACCANEKQNNFFAFARNLGCFSTKKFDEKTLMCQKASSLLYTMCAKLGNSRRFLDLSTISNIERILPENLIPNPEFLKFLSEKENLDFLIHYDLKYNNFFAKFMENFDAIKQIKKTTGTWESASFVFLSPIRYDESVKKYPEIVLFATKNGLSREVAREIVSSYELNKQNNVKSHILGKEFNEKKIIREKIEQIKNDCLVLPEQKEVLISKLKDIEFTFEFLDKNLLDNLILGSECGGCATLARNADYGRQIAKSAFERNDVQNIVIFHKNERVAKCALYINKEKGYGVINQFCTKVPYGNSKMNLNVYHAFLRAINTFAEEYNNQNKQNPIMKINIGDSLNCDLFEYYRTLPVDEKLLNVPIYFVDAVGKAKTIFQDASEIQHTIYKSPLIDIGKGE